MSLLPLTQYLTYWTIASVDGNGDPTWTAGIAIKCRWVRKEGVATDDRGDEHRVTYAVYSTVLIPRRSMVHLSNLNTQALPEAGSRKVIDHIENPSLTNLNKHVM